MNSIPKRPKADGAMILAACEVVAAKINADARTIAKHYSRHMDGYELAKELDKFEYWDTSREDMEALDEVDYLVDKAEREAIKAWADEHKPQPPIPVGKSIKEGIIAGIDDFTPAAYRVKEKGCKQDGRFLIINFEDAVAA